MQMIRNMQTCLMPPRCEGLLISKTLLQEEVIQHLKALNAREATLSRVRDDLKDAEFEADQLRIALRYDHAIHVLPVDCTACHGLYCQRITLESCGLCCLLLHCSSCTPHLHHVVHAPMQP